MKTDKEKEIKEFENWRIREELKLQFLVAINSAVKNFKSTTIEGYKPTNNDINYVISEILNRRLKKK
jgi:hypothetical protein